MQNVNLSTEGLNSPTTEPNKEKEFYFPTFNLGKFDPPTREEMYEERTRQILGLDDDNE